MTKANVFNTAQEINKGIASLKVSGKALQAKTHALAMACTRHAIQHGDSTLMDKLIKGLPAMARANALKSWALAYGPFRWDGKANNGEGGIRYKKRETYDLDQADAEPFYVFEKEAKFKPFDLDKALHSLLKRAEAASSDSRNHVNTDTLNALQKVGIASGKLPAKVPADTDCLEDVIQVRKEAPTLA